MSPHVTRRVRCPMGDWAQPAPDQDTAVTLLVRHVNEAHTVGEPDRHLLARIDTKLAAAGCTYQPPDGRYVP